MTDMMVKIMVEVLDILATATKEMKQSRFSESTLLSIYCLRLMGVETFLKRVAGMNKLDGGLQKLDKMTNEEARMANAEVLRLTHTIDENVQGVNKGVQGVSVQVQDVDENVRVIREMVQMIITGAQTELRLSPSPSLIYKRLNQLDRGEAPKGPKLLVRITYDARDVNRS
jgi:hypothetical protein